VPRRRFLDALMGAYMLAWDRRLGTSAHGTTYEPCGPLVAFLYGACQETRLRVLEGDVCEEATAAWIAQSLEDRKGGLTKTALRMQVKRGSWLKLGKELESAERQGGPYIHGTA